MMHYSYYVGDGPEAEKVIGKVMEKIESFNDACRELEAEFPEGTLALKTRNGLSMFARRMDQAFSPEQMKELGLRHSEDLTIQGDERVHAYVPNRRLKKGKELKQRIYRVNKHSTGDFNDEAKKLLRINRMLAGPHAASRTGMALYFTVIATDGKKLFVKIPGAPGDKEDRERRESGMGSDMFPDLPAWLHEPAGDEFKVFLR